MLQEIPQTVNVIPAQVIRDQAPRNLDDALANVSGITQGNTLGSTQDSVMTRGFGDNRNGSIMRDGMPVVQGRGLNATVDRVEVLKGPASLLYGIQDPGGVVNMVSKKPELRAVQRVDRCAARPMATARTAAAAASTAPARSVIPGWRIAWCWTTKTKITGATSAPIARR